MTELSAYMQSRRSALSLTLKEPGPSAGELRTMIEIASRVPDHGKLAPWRFVEWSFAARQKMHADLIDLLKTKVDLKDAAKAEKSTDKILHGPCVIAVISTAGDHPKIPEWEQILSAGAVCMNLLIAANGAGFDAQWLTAWYVYDDAAREVLQLQSGERIAGIIHIGKSDTPKNERPRPDVDTIFSQRSE